MTDKFLYLFKAKRNQLNEFFITDGTKYGKLLIDDPFKISRNDFYNKVKGVRLTEENLTNITPIPLIENSHIVLGTGMTYKIPNEELLHPVDNIYKKIYLNKRPMIFMKGLFSTMAPNIIGQLFLHSGVVSVPEAELVAIVNYKNEVIGYTLGNDFTAIEIEKENPLYQTQAKFFNGSFSLLEFMIIDYKIPEIDITTTVYRHNEIAYIYTYNTNKFVNDVDDIISHIKVMDIHKGCFLFLGCGAKTPESLSIQNGDKIIISSNAFPFFISNIAKEQESKLL